MMKFYKHETCEVAKKEIKTRQLVNWITFLQSHIPGMIIPHNNNYYCQ